VSKLNRKLSLLPTGLENMEVTGKHVQNCIQEMTHEDIDSNFFKNVAKLGGVELVFKLLDIFERVYPNAKEGQRKISVPLKSTLILKANNRMVDALKS